jgi:hypothetical protein
MKIYVQPPEIDINPLQERLNQLEDGNELRPILQNILTLQEKYLEVVQQKLQLQIMWALRSIEKEIDEEGGMILLTTEGEIELKEFSPELSEKISQCIKENMN